MIEFKPAIRVNTPVILALAGASGSGKTKTALELAVGLAGPKGKIVVIDSEGRRALHYADDYTFDHGEWRPPFTPETLLTALKGAEAAGYAVIIVDSASDEYEGEGGLQDMAADDLKAQRGDGNSAAAWARPKAQHKLIIKWLRQCRCHVIFALRSEEKVKFEKRFNERKQREETVIVPVGWIPICEKRFMFDMTTSLLFTPDHPGVPLPIKLYEKHARFFPQGKQVTRAAGEALAAWANGGVDTPVSAQVDNAPKATAFIGSIYTALMQAGDEAALKGTPFLENWWLRELETAERVSLGARRGNSGPNIARWKEIAAKVDTGQAVPASAQRPEAEAPTPPEEPSRGDIFPVDNGLGLPDARTTGKIFADNVVAQVLKCSTLDAVDEVKAQWKPQMDDRRKMTDAEHVDMMSRIGDHETMLMRKAQGGAAA